MGPGETLSSNDRWPECDYNSINHQSVSDVLFRSLLVYDVGNLKSNHSSHHLTRMIILIEHTVELNLMLMDVKNLL